jgi:hypothetical protein
MPVRDVLPDLRYFVGFFNLYVYVKKSFAIRIKLPYHIGTLAVGTVLCSEMKNENVLAEEQPLFRSIIACVRKNGLLGENNYLN